MTTLKELYEKIYAYCDNIYSDEARDMIRKNPTCFIYNAESVDKIVKELGNYRLPTEEIRKSSAKWHYDKGLKIYDNAIKVHEGEDKEKLLAEKELYKILFEYF